MTSPCTTPEFGDTLFEDILWRTSTDVEALDSLFLEGVNPGPSTDFGVDNEVHPEDNSNVDTEKLLLAYLSSESLDSVPIDGPSRNTSSLSQDVESFPNTSGWELAPILPSQTPDITSLFTPDWFETEQQIHPIASSSYLETVTSYDSLTLTTSTSSLSNLPPSHATPSSSNSTDLEAEPSSFSTEDARWAAVLSRDHLANNHFLYCVLSTSIFCRPTCPSRRPSRDNVAFVLTPLQAHALGCRPCKRCDPEGGADPTVKRQEEIVDKLKVALLREAPTSSDGGRMREVGAGDSRVTVKKVAEEIGVSMWHLNRLFKKIVGCPPQTWARDQKKTKKKVVR
ncbi:uncharacterized protein STEHIDRAFT_152168 [Stereum hirsutum FP-91666 SS1]|uniref:uncharacterized protein n=1 Tax=Stereum hirsutum (strain FP-91666) TaxID=721885 RepID=UPI000440A05D|nr:uncharacterized protein STEHIDRAFT_152168 [Stereum hirsutum FP-91666 SS1]EIM92865.1 hypothetical protein STEHIDRAFT_152168 [Stereum hirsutum FP-91666 SS1]